jgi:hypothetical protein
MSELVPVVSLKGTKALETALDHEDLKALARASGVSTGETKQELAYRIARRVPPAAAAASMSSVPVQRDNEDPDEDDEENEESPELTQFLKENTAAALKELCKAYNLKASKWLVSFQWT